MITPENKDKILNYLLAIGVKHTISFNQPVADIPWEYAEIILDQFGSKGLANQIEYNKGNYILKFTAHAYDFQRHGGFEAEELLYNMEIDKLILELDKLEKKFPEYAQTFANVIGGLTGLTALLHR